MSEYIKLLVLLAPIVALVVGAYVVLRSYNPECSHGEAWEDECADCERYF